MNVEAAFLTKMRSENGGSGAPHSSGNQSHGSFGLRQARDVMYKSLAKRVRQRSVARHASFGAELLFATQRPQLSIHGAVLAAETSELRT